MGWLRYDLIRRHLARGGPNQSVLEIGAGQGAMAARLAREHDYLGIEQDATSLEVASARLRQVGRGRLVQGDDRSLEPAAEFDVVCAFEVLEHLSDDLDALLRWRSHLRPGGLLLLSVPAHQHRFGPWDQLVGHHRRYDPQALAGLLARAGFDDVRVELYGFPIGYLLEAVRDAVARRRAHPAAPEAATAASGRLLQPGRWTGLALRAGVAPFRLLQRPFRRTELGIGIVAAGRRAP